MSSDDLFPRHIRRDEEQQILELAAQVRDDHKSRAVLLFGPGGVGKTSLVRALADANKHDATTIWLDPIDLDDSAYWLLSNLELKVADHLDPENLFFREYRDYLRRLPSYTRPAIGHETVVSHLGRIKRVFIECYNHFVMESKSTTGGSKAVVIVLDTVETIRNMHFLLTLTQWMKALHGTLFILSGRPVPLNYPTQDPIQHELDDPYQRIPSTTILLGEFTEQIANDYITRSRISGSLTSEEKRKLVLLTRGHPLWLAFAISYLDERGMPDEVKTSLVNVEQQVPYGAPMSPEGRHLHEAFKRRLLTPYREADFWHEAVKRLAVVRQSVSEQIWHDLMDDIPLPDDAPTPHDAWRLLLDIPWIRPRANARYVTLHDVVAEELAQRIIPVHDPEEQWRRNLWHRTVRIYAEYTEGPDAEIAASLEAADNSLQSLDEWLRLSDDSRTTTEEETRFIREVARLDRRKRELDQLKAARLYYQLLCDFAEGCAQFLSLFEKAQREHDILFQELLALEMQRFLPGGADRYSFDDVVGKVIDEFRRWLSAEKPHLYLEVGISMSDYLIRNERPQAAIDLLDKLPSDYAGRDQSYRLSILRGNAYLRIPTQVRDGLRHFKAALDLAQEIEQESRERQRLIAKAYKELGFYYRNEGAWEEADKAYAHARDAISAILTARSPAEDREEMASIQTNWAYVKGLTGSYREGTNLVEPAIKVRHRLNKRQEEGISWSVCGEVYRYERKFHQAWQAYAKSEQIFQELKNWPWLGLLYQEQAICLFQATEDNVSLGLGRDPIEAAERLITLALDICRDQAIRGYPSALNRAARIFGQQDHDAGLRYLTEGIEQARILSDGWFWFANLIEFVELSYRAWMETDRQAYRDQIFHQEAAIEQAMTDYEFPDLQGRWELLRGHLAIHDWERTLDNSLLIGALANYREGFALIARRYVGSSGAAAIPAEFSTFSELLSRLPEDVRAQWQEQLRSAWSNLDPESATLLLARLEELY